MFFFKRFLLAFCPRKGYGQLMGAGIGGAFGVMVIMTLIGGFVLSLVVSKASDSGAQWISGGMNQLPPFKVEQGHLVVPNVPQPFVYNDKSSDVVVVVDTTNRTTAEMVKASFPQQRYKVLLTRDYVYYMPSDVKTSKPVIMPMVRFEGMNNNNSVDFVKKQLGVGIAAIVWISVILSIIGRSIVASILAGIMTAVSVDGIRRTFRQTCAIVLHSMIPATLFQIVVNAVTSTRISLESIDFSGAILQGVGFTVVVIVMSLYALYNAEPENSVS